MPLSRRRPPPPWDRARGTFRSPSSRATRRFPGRHGYGEGRGWHVRAYDGTGDERDEARARMRLRRNNVLDRLRRHPIKHGLVGLTVAGAAIPLALQRQAERANPSHEQMMVQGDMPGASDQTVADVWQNAERNAEDAKAAAREAKVDAALERYAQFDLDRKMAEDIYDLALEQDIDPDLAFGLVRAESEFKNYATSHVGAIGLTQLMPKTARWLQPDVTTRDLRDQRTNLRIGFRYLKDMLEKYDGNERLALLAYNRGPGTVDRVLKRGGNPDNGYVEMVRHWNPPQAR